MNGNLNGHNGAAGGFRERNASGERSPLDDVERADTLDVRRDVRGEVGPLIDSLRTLFQGDRATASQGNATRCGICYLHFPLAQLEYRESEGYYVCAGCGHALGAARLPMVRRQKRL
jgi:hypothetical protein